MRVADATDLEEAQRRFTAGMMLLAPVGAASAIVLFVIAPCAVDLFNIVPALRAGTVMAVRLLAVQLVVEFPAVAMGSGLEGLRRYELRRGLDAALRHVVRDRGGRARDPRARGNRLAAASLVIAIVYACALSIATYSAGLTLRPGGTPREELRRSFPLLAMRAAGVGYRQIDRIVLGILATTVAVAGFDVADKLNLVALTMLGIATSALIPAAAVNARRAPADNAALVRRATKWTAIVTLPITGFVFGAAVPLCHAIAGTDIPGAVAATRSACGRRSRRLGLRREAEMAIGAGAGWALARWPLVALGVNLVGSVVLARAYGLAGSAAATAIATSVAAPAVTAVCARMLGVRPRDLLPASTTGFVAPFGCLVIALAASSTSLAAGAQIVIAALPAVALTGALVAFSERGPGGRLRRLRTNAAVPAEGRP